jgi:hypothetical protein
MQKLTKNRVYELIDKNAPLSFITQETGLRPTEILKLSNEKFFKKKPKSVQKKVILQEKNCRKTKNL